MTRKLLTALVLLLIGIGQAQSQTVTLTETYFPDAKFRAYISSITGVAEGGTLSEEKLKSVTYIDVSGYYSANGGITSLKGVEYFTALETLICYDNQLSSLDVSQNIALTTLYCYDNQLTSLDVSQNTALTSLSCFGNQLTSLDVSGATALTSLSCGSNQLMSLDVSQNTALTDLSCYGNQLTSLDVSHNTALTRLYCSSNQLMSLDLSKCTKLTYISFLFQSKSVIASSLGSNQYIIDVPADFDLSKVTSFKVNSVSVTPTLSEGKLKFTSSSVPTSVSYEYNTENSVAGNMEVTVTITSVEDESEDAVVLDATNFPDPIFRNCISGITGVAEGGTLSEDILNSVTRIDVGEPDKQNLRQNWTYKGEIKSLKGIEYFKNLTHLICFNNKLTDLDVSQNTALQCLICYENKLTSLDLSKNTELIQLECYRNKLMCLDLNNCTKLTTTTIAKQINRKAISSLGSDQYSIDVPAGFDLSKVSSFKVNYVDVTPTLSNGKLFFTSTSVPDDISYNYDSANNIAGEMNVIVDILNGVETEIELNSTNFPDGNFLTTLSAIWHLPIGDTFVPERVTHLNLHGDYLDFWSNPGEGRGTISNLQGIEFFTALEELDCSYNFLTSLDVSQNAALTRLDCSDNKLPSLDVSQNTELTSLNCGYNQLTSLDVSQNTELTSLNCGYNQLTSLDVSKNSVLKELVCRNNQLTKLVASGCTALERLELNDNPQMTLDLSGCTALTELDYDGQLLTILNVSGCTSLTMLSCNNNQLTSLDISNCTALTRLSCNNNQLASLDISSCTALTRLSCNNNQLISLDNSGCTTLTDLLCSNNQLTTLDLSGASSLLVLNCSGNQLMCLDTSKCPDLAFSTHPDGLGECPPPIVSPQKLVLSATSVGINKYIISVPADFNLSKVSSFRVNSVSVTPTLSNGNLQFSSSSVPTSVTYEYDTSNSNVRNMSVTVDITSIESGVVLNDTNFPDDTFRAYISGLTGVAEGGKLSEENLKSVTSIDVSGTPSTDGGITSLKGVEYFTALTTLKCSYNHLPSLDVSQNTALTRLECNSNQLTSLDVSQNTALTWLDCSGNQLTSLDVSQNTALTGLYCYYNELTSLDVSQNTALTELSCSCNQLSSLDVSQNSALTKLYCDENLLTSLDVSHNTALKELSCSCNQLSSLDVSLNTALTTLDCHGNQLMSLDLSKCTKLQSTSTSVSSQSISVIAYSLGANQYCFDVPSDFNLSKVTSFKVNSVSVTPTLSEGKLLFTSSSVPTSVSYEYNTDNSAAGNMEVTVTITSLEEVSGVILNDTNFPDDTFRSYISNLTGVPEGGRLSEEMLTSVTSIDVSGSSSANGGITNLKGVEYFTALTTLKCAYNLLTSLDVSQNTALTRLECNSNQLTSLDVSQNAVLTTLACDENQLPSLDVSQNPALTELRCSYNLLSSLEVSQNTTLTELGCDRNQLSSLDLSQNTALTKLYCSDNQLTSLDLSQNTALTTLSCGDNQLWDLDFSHNTALTELDCWGNQLTSLDLSQNTALTSLGCVSNQLTSLDLSQNTELSALECYGNLLMNLDLSNCTKLTYSLVSSQATSVVASSLGSNQYSIDVPADFDLSKVSSFTVNSVSVSPTLSDGKLLFTSVSVPTSVSYEYNTDNSVAGNMEVTVTVTSFEDESGVVLNAVNFPDAKFRAYISSVTGVAEGGMLTEAKLTSVTSIDVSGNASANGGITRLKGLEYFTALTTLKCAYNKLSSLDLSQNTALNYLYCNNNQLSSLDVSQNTALTELDCSSNQLTGLDVSQNAALTELECSSNQLTSLDVSQNAALTELECNSNQLTGIDVSMNIALKTLSCYSNQLMNLDLSKCTKLSAASVSSQSKSVVASSWGSNQYSIDVPADFNLSKVTSFKVNSVSVIPTLSNGKLLFITSSVPTSVSYEYNTDNSVAGSMSVTVDITAVEDAAPANTVYMDDMEVMTGMEETLSVKMKNEVPMVGFEFDLYVPEGVTVATDGDGFPEVYLSTERTTARKTNSFDAVFLPDGGVRVQATSTNGSAFSGNDGEVVTVKVNIGADMAEGDYTVLLKNIALSGTDAVSYPTEQMSSTLHVTSGTLGDANRDKRVDVADFTTTAHYILGKNPDPFNDLAADANRDESIDMNDLTAIAHIILYGSVDKPASWANGLPRRAPAAADGTENGEGYPWTYVYIDPLTVESGTEQTLSVKMKNAVDAEGFEFDLYLPDGMSFVLDADGFPETNLSTERTTTRKTNSFDAVILPDGGLRVLAASTNASAISGHDGDVAQVKVRIDSDVPTGTYLLTLKEIAVSDVDCVSHRTDELVSGITVVSRDPTSLRNVETDGDADNTYYNMSGQRINKPTRSGVYIQRGKKVVVK